MHITKLRVSAPGSDGGPSFARPVSGVLLPRSPVGSMAVRPARTIPAGYTARTERVGPTVMVVAFDEPRRRAARRREPDHATTSDVVQQLAAMSLSQVIVDALCGGRGSEAGLTRRDDPPMMGAR